MSPGDGVLSRRLGGLQSVIADRDRPRDIAFKETRHRMKLLRENGSIGSDVRSYLARYAMLFAVLQMVCRSN